MVSRIAQLLLIICVIMSIISAQDTDFAILQALKAAWKNTPPSWDDSSVPCDGSWDGITCANDRVTKIILVGCSFTGPIPDTIGNLESLIDLSLNSNGFTGPIPASVGNITKLYWLDLSANKLTGSIPVSNQITSTGLDKLTHAKHFHLGDNLLSGDIPPKLFHSSMILVHLLLENNKLTGSVPSTLGLVRSLEVVRLDRNFLKGSVPSNINNLTNTTEMFLSNNHLTGKVPNLTGMNLLNYIDLSNNSFDQSDVPSWFSTLKSLTTIKMHKTNLVGELPAALFRIPQLQNVDLSNNLINGNLDISLNPSTQLELVDLRSNQIGDFTQRHRYSIGLILAENPICMESGVTDRFCHIPTNTTRPYSTPTNNCMSPSCGSRLVLSRNCHCALPYTGLFLFKATSFSSVGNFSTYISLQVSLMRFFQKASLPVDSVSLTNPYRNSDDYLVIKLDVGEPFFNRTGILGIGFALSNQTFKPSKEFNTFVFIAENYANYFSGITGTVLVVTKDKSSNIGIVIGSVVGGCLLVVLLVLAGIYAFRRRERAERRPQQSQPFGLQRMGS